jgi:hydrogenase maturation protease
VDADYQLTVEDAAQVAEHDTVVFIDADTGGPEPFSFKRLEAKRQESFSSHSVAPEGVLGLAEELFDARCNAYMLGIRGYSFRMFTETMTEKARENLEKALAFLFEKLRDDGLE